MPCPPPPTHTRTHPWPRGAGATCILRFLAGAPYEDIAFRIINKDWWVCGVGWRAGGWRVTSVQPSHAPPLPLLPPPTPLLLAREYNHKRGFKCVFERGILHLYFNFQRQRYRR